MRIPVLLSILAPTGSHAAPGEAGAVAAPAVKLVREGTAAAVVVLAGGADITLRAAAGELVGHVALMTGVELPVVILDGAGGSPRPVRILRGRAEPMPVPMLDGQGFRMVDAAPAVKDAADPARELLPIRLGEAADAALDGLMDENRGGSDAFALQVDTAGVQIRARQPVGIQHGVYEILRQLGVRWFDPLADGLVAPIRPGSKNNLALPHQRIVSSPSGEMRWMSPVTPRATMYTTRMKAEHVERVRRSRYATPTASADEEFVLGHTLGTKDAAMIFEAAHIPPILDAEGRPAPGSVVPPQKLFGYRITDREATGEKRVFVLTAGNHTEPTGCWTLHAVIEFLLGDDPRAALMRRKAEFYVYPLSNPEGRYVCSRVCSPETCAAGWGNHHRAWNTAGVFATIDTLTAAMRYDTRCRVDYLIDFHSGSPHGVYVPEQLAGSAFIRSLQTREGQHTAGFEHSGSTMHFALHEDGLRSPRAFLPENDDWKSLDHCLQVGRNVALALHDILSGAQDDSGERVESFGASLAAGAPPPVEQRDAPKLLKAVAKGDIEAAKKSLAAGDDINGGNSVGNRALHIASEQGHEEIVRWLLEKGAGVSQSNLRGWTPLHYAVRYKNGIIASLLLEKGADVNARTIDGDTPLLVAAAFGRSEIAQALLSARADASLAGRWNRTPLDWAVRLGYDGIAAQLREALK